MMLLNDFGWILDDFDGLWRAANAAMVRAPRSRAQAFALIRANAPAKAK